MASSVQRPQESRLRLADSLPHHWRYVAEGGATVVFSYHGPHHSIFTSRALRLRKVPRSQPNPSVSASRDPVGLAVEFQNKVVTRLLDPAYLVGLQVVSLEIRWAEAFAAYHDPQRPPSRRNTDVIDTARSTAVLTSDLVGRSRFSVEIKPKWGFLPNPTHLSPESKPIKTRTCRTCMHAHLKQVEGRPAPVYYCPLDLFSGSGERIKTALEGLWDSWQRSDGTFNNLRIFHYGKPVLPSDESSLRLWSQENFSLPSDAALTSLKSHFVSSLLPSLLRTPLLQEVSALQRRLDSLDCEGWVKLSGLRDIGSDDLKDDAVLLGSDMEPSVDDWASFVDVFLSSESGKHSNFDPTNLRYHTLAYMLSATLKDCSIIIPLHSRPGDGGVPTPKVIDLDIKSAKKIPGWIELDEKVVREYAKVDPSLRKTCVDGGAETGTARALEACLAL